LSNRTISMTDRLYDYLLSVSVHEHPELARLRAETAKLAEHNMQISPEQGQFLALLVRLMGARRCIEVGTFTGYSALAVALALPAEGRLIALDVSETWTAVARRHWAAAGVASRIELRLAPALVSLDALLREGQAGGFDFAFIDADKETYQAYYERVVTLLRPGGLVAVDNTLWSGTVADPTVVDRDTAALRAFNAALYADSRIDLSLVPIGDGLTLARKR
jgi:predicted O-methyltransferase YrrM